MSHRLVIPQKIPSQNVRDRWHWRQRSRERDQWVASLRAIILADRIKLPHHPQKIHLTITSIRRQRIKDDANLRGGAKGMVDALVTVGVLHDDSNAWCYIEYRQMTRVQAGVMRECTVIEWRVS